ncbi:leucine-rich repeat-containing protein 15-like [Anopheles ziemanni]|uniref:leucine-rich repeat-containing protein 15-like n=1 Tax=Anopheles ziemanni TaxID=345580 RepID=UPI00265EE973|nr:leucine-rich repeat-containing protein 15-like [Anopheles ziemanni]
MQPPISFTALLAIVCSLVCIALANTIHECTVEKRQDEHVCVFRSVVYRANDTNFVFKAPASPKVEHIVFEDSTLNHIPTEFLTAFPTLKALTVVQANLSSVVIPSKLERLYASNNRISKVIVHQTKDSTTMTELILDSNHLSDISNLTRLAKLEILMLSGNKELPFEDTVDLGRFKGLDSLRSLVLSDVGMMYVENKDNVALPSLELLDLSNNNLITTNLEMKVLAPMKKLEILRLTHTLISDLEALQLTQNNGNLRKVYLEGNNFQCDRQKQIVDHFNLSGVETPVDNKNANCIHGFQKQNDICCQTAALGKLHQALEPTTKIATSPEVQTTTPSTSTMPSRMEKNKESAATLIMLGNGLLVLTFVAILKSGWF